MDRLSSARRWLLCLGVIALSGCASIRKSDTARTGSEQMLISNAVDQALAKIDYRPLAGHKIYLDEKYMEGVDKNYVLASVRHRILKVGAEIMEKPDQAEMIVEVRSGAIGTDDSNLFVGVPALNLGPMMSIPEIAFFKRQTQTGTAKIGMVAYDAKTKHVLGDGAVTRAQAQDKNWFALGMGPYTSGNLKEEVEVANTSADQFPLEVGGDQRLTVHLGQIQQTVFASPGSPEGNKATEGLATEPGRVNTRRVTPARHDGWNPSDAGGPL